MKTFPCPFVLYLKSKLQNDQICYEFDPGNIIQGEDTRHGLHLILDDNQDRMMQISFDQTEDLEDKESDVFEYDKDDEKDGIKVYLDTIG